MKEFLKNIKNWLTFWVSASLVIVISLIIYTKARNSSSSWVTVDNSNPAALYVGNNETLTAAKRNRLVQWNEWQEVDTSDTALFDADCDRRWQAKWWTNVVWFYSSMINYWSTKINSYGTSQYRNISNTSKSTVNTNDWVSRTLQKLQKKCK